MKQKKLSLPIILVPIWVAAVVIASFYDLNISLAIADEASLFGRALEIAGEPPAILFTSFNFALMMAHFVKKPLRSARDNILAVLTLVVTVGTSIFTFKKITGYLSDYGIIEDSIGVTAISAAAALLTAAAFIAVVMKMNRKSIERYFETACRCAAAAVATFVIIWLFKLTWGRVRPRQLGNDISRFTPWYLPQGFNGYFSFPSGHTANATVIVSLTAYLKFLPQKYQKITPLIMLLLGVWIALVALSRVIVGAHYLSDVLFGAAITIAIVYFTKGKNKNVH